MKYNIKHKLTGAFILVIILTAVTVIMSFFILSTLIKNDSDMKVILSLKSFSQKVTEQITKNFESIGNYDLIIKQVEPLINKYDAHLEVIDSSGIILFDSKKSDAIIQMQKYKPDPNSKEAYNDANLLMNENGLLTIISPIIIDNYKAGTVFLTVNSSLIDKITGIKSTIYLISLFLIPVILIAVIILIFTRVLSRDIIIPLKELNYATQMIAQGDLSFEIKYNKNNELGKFCKAFDEMRETLRDSLDRQAACENSRKELIASISHDLRTPISTIMGYADGLQDGIAKDSEMFKRYVSVIKSKSESLYRLIDDLMQFSQFELEKLNMQLCTHNSKIMFEEILAPIELEYENSGMELIIDKPIPEVMINADIQRIGQVVDNLLQNARRYASSGGKIVFIASVQDKNLLISVKDYGQGISDEDLPRIFDRFYRGEKSRNRLYGGIGLGLAICKHIIEEHGGRIWAESTSGEGSTFYLTLPVIL